MEELDQAVASAENREEDEEYSTNPADLAKHWEKEVTATTKWLEKFHDGGKRIEKVYLSKDADSSRGEAGTHFNLFWSNIQVMLAATYAKLPLVDVSRKFKDYEDDVARVAGVMLQRILNADTWNVNCGTDETFRNILLDRFVPGMGVSWVRYDMTEVQMTDPQTQQQYPVIGDEDCPVDHVRWDDFLMSPCRTWTECRWVGRKRYMSKKELEKRFGEKIAEQIKLDVRSANRSESEDPQRRSPYDQGTVLEIWCKTTKRVYWYAKGCPVILDFQDDPLELDGFFPCPKPLVSTMLTNNFIPRPEYVILQDQYGELELVTRRITLLTEAIKVMGAYDKEAAGAFSNILSGDTNKMVPVDNWAMFAEKGGIKGVVDWFPIDQIVNALEKLTQRKRELMQEIYEILGISDLMRGQTKASETLGAQQLKAQFGGQRVDNLQKGIAKFMSETMQLRGMIICKHWQPQTIIQKSQIMMTPDKKFAEAAVQLLKSQGMFNVKLEVLSETIAAPDWEAEKRQRTEFLQATSQFIGMSMPLIQSEPGATPFLVQMLQWAAAGFQAGKTLEGVLDQALQQLQASITAPKPPKPPTPEDAKNISTADKNFAAADKDRAEIGLPPTGQMLEAELRRRMTPPDPQQGGGQPPQPGGPQVPPQGMVQ